ncbi:VWA domain-containing protein [Candidatus Albibeggiatoa sp. nov. NOAA]|uniref:vWA domain-containing protein n=1 Tax=Candidatus Albibeggiatoa sp. nov. NOAA TaxID=3162724 RepID=UPI0032FABC84|nr:VWA domain-containing protein [Thiotrichaceae bacterium]
MSLFKHLHYSLLFLFLVSISQTSYAFLGFFGKTETIELELVYSSEKQAWLDEMIPAFNEAKLGDKDKKFIVQVKAKAMGSGEMMQMLVDGEHRPHLVSPASNIFIELYNERAKSKAQQPIVTEAHNLVLSPVVIAMWQPMAEALGWPDKLIGWEEIFKLATSENGWGEFGHPEWGEFKFGHTHPEYSNSGMLSVLAEAYAGAGKSRVLKMKDVNKQKTQNFIQAIESSVIHYGRSTGFFSKKMFGGGSELLNAVVLYENMVIESYLPEYDLKQPIVAIYPKEGTFWSDHPIGIVERSWVDEKHRAAAKVFTDYLLAPNQQNKAQEYGLRPANLDVPLHAPFDKAHGVDPKQPQTILPIPQAKVMEKLLTVWQKNKKHADILLVFDISGSMKGQDKIKFAQQGAFDLLNMLRPEDKLSLLLFNHKLNWLGKQQNLESDRPFFEHVLHTIQTSGGTALYDAVDEAYEYMLNNRTSDSISAIVVLSDGADGHSKNATLESLLEKMSQSNAEIGVYPIAYGSNAEMSVLRQIAKAAFSKAYSAETTDISVVFQEIATFF